MGDHRASIKIEFQIYNSKVYKMNSSCNYSPSDCCRMDAHVINFFQKAYEESRAEWDAELYKRERERNKEAEEKAERLLLAELKAKYEKI